MDAEVVAVFKVIGFVVVEMAVDNGLEVVEEVVELVDLLEVAGLVVDVLLVVRGVLVVLEDTDKAFEVFMEVEVLEKLEEVDKALRAGIIDNNPNNVVVVSIRISLLRQLQILIVALNNTQSCSYNIKVFWVRNAQSREKVQSYRCNMCITDREIRYAMLYHAI